MKQISLIVLLTALALLLPVLLGGCGGERSTTAETWSSQPPERHPAYVREMKVTMASLRHSQLAKTWGRADSLEEYLRAAVALDTFLSEIRAHLRRIEELDPPDSCTSTHNGVKQAIRRTIQVYEGALPFYRHNDPVLVKAYMQSACRILRSAAKPLKAFVVGDQLPC